MGVESSVPVSAIFPPTRSTWRAMEEIQSAIVDTSPLVAMLDDDDHYHAWAMAAFQHIRGPMMTCEPVIGEAFFLLKKLPKAQDKLLEWINLGSLSVPFILAHEAEQIRVLL